MIEKSIEISNESNKKSTKYFYPQDLSTEPFMQNLIQANRIYPIQEETYFGAEKLTAQKTVFTNTLSNDSKVLPHKQYVAKFPNDFPNIANVGQLECKATYDKYDDKGNLLQITEQNGISTVFIWGYKKMYPIAKIENATYAQVQQYETNLQAVSDSPNSETALQTALNALRTALPNAMITTYTYLPLIGISTMTAPNGDITKYQYDYANRLKTILDKDNKILENYEYQYR
ncbi:MAG: hypothetical protein HC854_03150 [Flavobacterium sp.]|nr:hypothetical protein [Flavobacterium sp.]